MGAICCKYRGQLNAAAKALSFLTKPWPDQSYRTELFLTKGTAAEIATRPKRTRQVFTILILVLEEEVGKLVSDASVTEAASFWTPMSYVAS